jgi:prepilin-type N-terminal cleavage/methylation domain-containing protein
MIGNERGVSLAEILIATAIIGIGLAGLMAVVPISISGTQEGNQLTTATFLAQQRLEQVRRVAWTATPALDCVGISASPSVPPTPSGATCNGSTAVTFADEAQNANPIAGFSQYARTTRIIDCGVGAGCGGVVNGALRLVTATVSYRPMTGMGSAPTDKTVRVEWLLAQR